MANVVMAFTILNMNTNAKERPKCPKNKSSSLSWCPDTARIKKKMLYSSSFDALKKALVGVHKYIQATDASEASKESVEEKLRSTDRS